MKSQRACHLHGGLLAPLFGMGMLVAGTTLEAAPAGQEAETLELSGVATLSETDLESARGREGINIVGITQSSSAPQDASISDNTISGVTTGDNMVDAGAF